MRKWGERGERINERGEKERMGVREEREKEPDQRGAGRKREGERDR